ncbi:MAG: hypothetical protein U9Q69_03225 [Nanoarchaeota archaeon]|nr:hypothetical protein [Nanoarchaeota archaeon]
MLQKLKISFIKLKDSEKFKEFETNNPEAYFVSAFFMCEYGKFEKSVWQMDFFDPAKYRMTSFVIGKDKIDMAENQKVFQKDKVKIEKLDLEEVDSFEEAIKNVEEKKNAKYKNESFTKMIVLLQSVSSKILWNLTFLTNSFKVWNIKVDAGENVILEEKMENIISFKAKSQ